MQSHAIAARVLRQSLTGAALALLSGACGPAPYTAPPVTPQLVKTSSAPAALLERGHFLYQAKCAKCHAFENPAHYGTAELTHRIMPDMARKSKLDPAGQQAVLAYLLAARNASTAN